MFMYRGINTLQEQCRAVCVALNALYMGQLLMQKLSDWISACTGVIVTICLKRPLPHFRLEGGREKWWHGVEQAELTPVMVKVTHL